MGITIQKVKYNMKKLVGRSLKSENVYLKSRNEETVLLDQNL